MRRRKAAAARQALLRLTAVGAACMATTLLNNPWGWKLYPHLVWYLSNGTIMQHMQELQVAGTSMIWRAEMLSIAAADDARRAFLTHAREVRPEASCWWHCLPVLFRAVHGAGRSDILAAAAEHGYRAAGSRPRVRGSPAGAG